MWVVAATEVSRCFGGRSALCPVLSSFSLLCWYCCCTWLLLLPSFLVGLACSWAINACSDNRPTAISRVVRARAQVFWVGVFVLLHSLCLFVSLFLTFSSPALFIFIFIISSYHLFSTPSSSSILFHFIVIFRFFAFRFMFFIICIQFYNFSTIVVNLASKLTQKTFRKKPNELTIFDFSTFWKFLVTKFWP